MQKVSVLWQNLDVEAEFLISTVMSQHKNGTKNGGTLYNEPLRKVMFHYDIVYLLQWGASWGLHNY